MSTPDHQQVLAELEAVRTRLANEYTYNVASALAVATFAFVGTALAANGNCPNPYPFCFAPDSPAQAAQVNHNFSQILEWLEGKVGTRTSAGVQTSAVTTTGNVDVTNNGRIVGTGSGAFHLNTMPANGTMYLNWHSGSGGVVVGNGASGAAVTMQSNGNVNLTTVNNRRPAVSVGANCSSGTCSASCSNGGVIREGWGFHGNNWNSNIGGGWACGGGIQWMGACIGQTSCTVSTGCGSSGIWIDCW